MSVLSALLAQATVDAGWLREFADEPHIGKGEAEWLVEASYTMDLLAATLAARASLPSLDALAVEARAWGNATFATATPASKAEHLRREAVELCRAPHDVEEMADVFLLLAHLSDGLDLAGAVRAKLDKNKQRTWGKPDADGVVEHVR